MQILPAVTKALTEFGLDNLIPSEAEIKQLEDISDVLDTVECGATALGRNDMDLGKADQVVEFMLTQLQQNSSSFSRKMNNAIQARISERRNALLSGLLRYLAGEDLIESALTYPSRSELIKGARDLYMRLFFDAQPPPNAAAHE